MAWVQDLYQNEKDPLALIKIYNLLRLPPFKGMTGNAGLLNRNWKLKSSPLNNNLITSLVSLKTPNSCFKPLKSFLSRTPFISASDPFNFDADLDYFFFSLIFILKLDEPFRNEENLIISLFQKFRFRF